MSCPPSSPRALWLLVLSCLLIGCAARDQVIGITTRLLDEPDDFTLEFEGNENYTAGLLQKAIDEDLQLFVDRGYPTTAIDDAAYTLEVHYNLQGYPFAQVEYAVTEHEDGRKRVLFQVQEGPRTLLRKTHFPGAVVFDSATLESHLKGPSRGAFGLGKLYYVSSEADSAARSIENLYYQEGYIDVRVPAPTAHFTDDAESVELTFSVIEGSLHRIHSIQLKGVTAVERANLRPMLDGFVGRPYLPRITHQLQAACSAHLADLGFADASCIAKEEIDAQTGNVRMELLASPGPRIALGAIHVMGNVSTATSFILSQIELTPGQNYSRANELASFRNLYSSGLFRSIHLDLKGDGLVRDLYIEVEEAETLSTSVEIGYGAFERSRILLAATESNLFGTGRGLTLKLKYAEKARGAQILFTDPYTIDRRHVLGLNLFLEQRKLVSFESAEYGAGLRMTHHIIPTYSHIYGYEYRKSEAHDVEVIVPGLNQQLLSDANVSAVYLTNVFDTRDSFFLPKEGTWLRLRTEYASDALASELSFFRFDGRAAHYMPITETSQLAIGLRAGLILPMQGTDAIPLQERFFNGGQNTVRSFREDELGPVDSNGKQVGGEAFHTLSLEYRHELVGNFSGALFCDAGNVALRHQDTLRFEGLRYAVGLGVRWLLPIGPLRLDWGVNPDRRATEENWVLQFSLGVAF